MDMQKFDSVDLLHDAAGTIHGRLVEKRDGTRILIRRTDDLDKALAAAASSGVVSIEIHGRFYEEGNALYRMSHRRAAGYDHVDTATAEKACQLVRTEIEEAVIFALGDRLDLDQHLDLAVTLDRDPVTASWTIRGDGNAYQLIDDLSDISVALD